MLSHSKNKSDLACCWAICSRPSAAGCHTLEAVDVSVKKMHSRSVWQRENPFTVQYFSPSFLLQGLEADSVCLCCERCGALSDSLGLCGGPWHLERLNAIQSSISVAGLLIFLSNADILLHTESFFCVRSSVVRIGEALGTHQRG